jgi:hypothetical protein
MLETIADPTFLQAIYAGVIANTVTGIAACLGRGVLSPSVVSETNFKKLMRDNPTLNNLLQTAAATAAKHLSESDASSLERIRSFLVSPEVESMVRQIFASTMLCWRRIITLRQ